MIDGEGLERKESYSVGKLAGQVSRCEVRARSSSTSSGIWRPSVHLVLWLSASTTHFPDRERVVSPRCDDCCDVVRYCGHSRMQRPLELFLVGVGVLALTVVIFRILLNIYRRFILPAKHPKSYGKWAIVTGHSSFCFLLCLTSSSRIDCRNWKRICRLFSQRGHVYFNYFTFRR
jgi:hypothetical protein